MLPPADEAGITILGYGKHRQPIRIAVVGAGQFGAQSLPRGPRIDAGRSWPPSWISTASRAEAAAAQYGAEAFTDFRELAGKVDAAVVAAPTTAHEEVGVPAAGGRYRCAGRKADRAGSCLGHPADRHRRAARPHPAGRTPGALQPGRDGAGTPRDAALCSSRSTA